MDLNSFLTGAVVTATILILRNKNYLRLKPPVELSESIEKKVIYALDNEIIEILVEEIPNMVFTKTYGDTHKHWVSRPKGYVLITENRTNDVVNLYVNNKEIFLTYADQIRIVNSLITCNGNSFNIDKK